MLDLREYIHRINLNSDLTRSPYIIYLSIIFALSRIPFLNLGFSAFASPADSDVLAVVNSAYLLRYDHVYTVSRFPGYPFYEYINAFFIEGGWIATNAATMVVSFICVLIFARILNFFKIRNKALLVLAFAFLPIIWINSVITMDYMWALMFILLGSYLAFTDKYLMAGVAIGFAVGTRFTSAFMIIPIVFWALSERLNCRKILTFIFTAVITSLILFLPVFHKYGFEFLQGSGFLHTTPVGKSMSMLALSAVSSLSSMAVELFGIIALAFLIFFAILAFKNKHVHESRQLLNFCWLTVLIFILLYFIFPYKVAYLIPVVPWGLIIVNEKLQKKHTVVICILLLLNSAVAFEIVDNDATPSIRLSQGIVIKNYEERKTSSIEQSEEYLKSLMDLSGK